MGQRICDFLHGRNNNFNLIRFLAATAVIYSHSFVVLYHHHHPGIFFGYTVADIGFAAVNVFFILAGFLVLKSILTRADIVFYTLSRMLRIVPALVIATLAVAVFLGPVVSHLPVNGYFGDTSSWLYIVGTSSLLVDSLMLPGVFEGLPANRVVNAPLWTLRYEVLCYGILAAIWLSGAMRSRTRALATLSGMFGAYIAVTFFTEFREQVPFVDSMSRFGLLFTLGAAFYGFREHIRLNIFVLLGLVAVAGLTAATPLRELTVNLALAYGIFWFAFVPAGALRRFNELGDYSYGLYILAWPIQQASVQFIPDITPHLLFVAVFPVVLGLAVLSWHLIERPALGLRYPLYDRIADLGKRRFGVAWNLSQAPVRKT